MGSSYRIKSAIGIGSKLELDKIKNELELELQFWNDKKRPKINSETESGGGIITPLLDWPQKVAKMLGMIYGARG